MKKIKLLLIGVILILFMVKNVDAATLNFNDSKPQGNKVVYIIKYTKAETDTDKKISFEITNSDPNIELTILKDEQVGGKCEGTICEIELPTITSAEGDTKHATLNVATVTLENKTPGDITTNLKLLMAGSTMDQKDNLKLTAGITEKVKSANSNLSSLSLSVGTMDKAFDAATTQYTVTGIKDTIPSVTINPVCAEGECKWSIMCPTGECSVKNTKMVTLQAGANQVSVNVTSEDGSSNKTYVLSIYRGEIETSSAYLTSIKIKDAKLSPTFDSLTNDYSTTISGDLEQLELDCVPEDPNAIVTIKGNENLIVGENTVTITVTSSDNANKQVYTLLVTKEEEEKEEKKVVTKTTKVEKKKDNKPLIIILSILGLSVIIVTFFIIFKKKKRKNKTNDKNNKNNGKKQKTEENLDINDDDSIYDSKKIVLKENTDNLNILEETRKESEEEEKHDIDEALDDLMKTKKLELGDLDF